VNVIVEDLPPAIRDWRLEKWRGRFLKEPVYVPTAKRRMTATPSALNLSPTRRQISDVVASQRSVHCNILN
jgi:hypothetical protein